MVRDGVLHSPWTKRANGDVVMHDRDATTKQHRDFGGPTIGILAGIVNQIEQVQQILNRLRGSGAVECQKDCSAPEAIRSPRTLP
jgi:hypothetical protein